MNGNRGVGDSLGESNRGWTGGSSGWGDWLVGLEGIWRGV